MPQGDGTGPAGQGPMTGRGLGRCVDAASRFIGFLRGRQSNANRGGGRAGQIPFGGGQGANAGGGRGRKR